MLAFIATYFIVIPVALALYGLWRLDATSRRTFLLRALVVTIISIILTLVGSALVSEQRPYIFQHTTSLLAHPPTDNSFPSDHTTAGFGASLLLLPFNPLLGGVGLIFSALVSLSRVAVHVHWPIDIVGGISIALVSNLIAYFWIKNKTR